MNPKGSKRARFPIYLPKPKYPVERARKPAFNMNDYLKFLTLGHASHDLGSK